MAYIYLHEEDLQAFIDKLKSYATSNADELTDVRRVNNQNDDPADIRTTISDSSTAMARSAALNLVATNLQVRLDEAVEMNSNGITPMDGEYISYYLPDDGEYADDTVANVMAFNSQSVENGTKDAEALQQARSSRDGVAEDGRTVEQILDEMAKHQDVPAYGASVVEAFGGMDSYLATCCNYSGTTPQRIPVAPTLMRTVWIWQ
ncbi:DUF6571 family protein [Actinomyces sp. MRS3W]|uniref:DUF6571 family protein n=1 Tax=Actinomyces sp. MRS3W TaxID=2800796 RepID=UPI0028FD822E|nr:DUF6571 family protein [Actinomyces sp. MRS3W]MDU0348684.1 DUF6571 family protein [Actinomyces sp. MRS3W]